MPTYCQPQSGVSSDALSLHTHEVNVCRRAQANAGRQRMRRSKPWALRLLHHQSYRGQFVLGQFHLRTSRHILTSSCGSTVLGWCLRYTSCILCRRVFATSFCRKLRKCTRELRYDLWPFMLTSTHFMLSATLHYVTSTLYYIVQHVAACRVYGAGYVTST